MCTQKNSFILNLNLLDQKKGDTFSDSQLSLQLGKSRSWLNSVRKRKNSNGTVCIKETEAVALARTLGCLVQDIGTSVVEPMEIDFAAIASNKLNILLQENQEFAAELVSWAVSADSEARLLLLAALKTLSVSCVAETNSSGETWFRYLLIAQLGKVLASDINETTERQIRAEYYRSLHALPEKASYDKKEMKILPQEKIGVYLAEAERRGLLPMFYLELTTGLRRGELLALLWTDLDIDAGTISVTKQVNRINGELVVSQPKTANSIRTLAIPRQAVELLIEEHKKHPHSPYMFPSPKTGTMYDPDSFRHTHDKILKTIGVEHIRFHDLRHTFATLSLKNGVDVKTLSGALGHYSAGFTLNTYTHATTQMKRDAADTIGKFISTDERK